jgi:hypothetical protein
MSQEPSAGTSGLGGATSAPKDEPSVGTAGPGGAASAPKDEPSVGTAGLGGAMAPVDLTDDTQVDDVDGRPKFDGACGAAQEEPLCYPCVGCKYLYAWSPWLAVLTEKNELHKPQKMELDKSIKRASGSAEFSNL